jgi:S1-C subfamily serine protease
VRTDYERNEVTLIDPDGFTYRGPGTRVKFELKETIPIVAGDIDGVPGTFQLDTGSRSTLDLMTPFVAKNDLVARFGAKVQGVNGWGVGGPARSWIVRGHRFSFGGVSVEAPVVGLAQAHAGAFSEAYTAGNVGAGVLKKFNIVWDYPRLQIFFERNTHYNDPDVFNRAGVWVNLGGGGFEVVDVFAGSPAADGGLKAGDRIIAVDGKQAQRELTLPDFRMRMKEAPGTKLSLEVMRGTQKLQIVVTLRDLV